MRTAVGIMESSHIRVMRVADNMRNMIFFWREEIRKHHGGKYF